MKRIAYYRIKEKGGWLPKHIEELFEKEITRFGVIYFEEGSEREKIFVDLVTRKGIETIRRTIISCTKREITNFPFFYLSEQLDRSYGQEKAFDMSTACGGDGGKYNILCRIGIKQKKKIMIDPNKSKKLDIMGVPWINNPKVYIVSSRLKNLLEEHRATGCKFIPCLEWGKDYPEEITFLDTSDENLAKKANYFQLLITESVNSPPSVGYVKLDNTQIKIDNKHIKIDDMCQKCKTVYNFKLESDPIFSIDDLRKTDFQVFDQYKSSNMGIFRIPGEGAIISSRILDLILRHKMKGIWRYLTDPPIQYGVVEIHGVTTDVGT